MVAQGNRTMMVGDGINDGPSLAAADVGVAMGLSGSDIATNSAGVALMTEDLNRVPFLIDLARKTRMVIAQNIAASIIIVIVGLVLSSLGLLAVPAAALYHFAAEVFVLANSFRLFRFGENFATADAERRQCSSEIEWFSHGACSGYHGNTLPRRDVRFGLRRVYDQHQHPWQDL